MTHKQAGSNLLFVVTLLTASALTISARHDETTSLGQAQSAAGTKTVRNTTAARTQVVSREVKGSFAQHPAALAELGRFVATAKVATTGPLMGIYPMDPDVVPEGELRWQVAVPVSATARMRAPYTLTALPASEVVSLDSSVADSHHDGLFMKKWVIDNGFVQIAPTRMLFHDLDNPNPMAVKTTIVFPVKRRQVMAQLLKRPGE
jgi:hypothetical protein